MFGNHVKNRLSAYCNGETDANESSRIAEHLLVCANCRGEYERIDLGAHFARHLKVIEAPEGIWNDIEDLLDRSQAQPSSGDAYSPRGTQSLAPQLRLRHRLVSAMAVLALLVVAVGVLLLVIRARRSGWVVDRISGIPRIESEPIGSAGRLKVGQWIETDKNSRVTLHPGNIGEVEVEPGSRLQLLKSEQNEYRLALQHGEVKALISAAPRLFFVNIPSATAVDLGCAYTLQVDDSGVGRIEVTAGMVEFIANGRKSMIPAGASCSTQPVIGPGTPYFEDASDFFKEALARIDSDRGNSSENMSAVDIVLSEARRRDSLTLWHLLSRVQEKDIKRVYEKLAQLVPPPPGVTLDSIERLDARSLESWFTETEPAWFQ